MCPGGYVVNASSENGRTCVNGMSYSGRDSRNANSAIIVTCLLKRISESDIEVNRIHCKSDGMKIIFKDIIQSPGEISIYIEVFEGSPSGTCL